MPHGSLAAFKQTLARKKARDVKKRSVFDNKNQVSKKSDKKTVFNFPKLSTAELETVKLNIRKKFKIERLKTHILTSIIFIILLALILVLIMKF